MCVCTELRNVLDAVAGSGTCPKMTGTDVHSIGTAVNGSLATLKVLRRGKQFKCSHSILLMSYGVA